MNKFEFICFEAFPPKPSFGSGSSIFSKTTLQESFRASFILVLALFIASKRRVCGIYWSVLLFFLTNNEDPFEQRSFVTLNRPNSNNLIT